VEDRDRPRYQRDLTIKLISPPAPSFAPSVTPARFDASMRFYAACRAIDYLAYRS